MTAAGEIRRILPVAGSRDSIAKPAVSVSTKFVYQNLKLNEQTPHPDIDALITDIRNSDLDNICADMGNVLETVTIPNYPVIAQINEASRWPHRTSCF